MCIRDSRHYVKKCGLQCIRTEEFKAAVEEFSGQDLAWFFDQWFMKPGYPVLKVRWKWDEAKKAEIVTVEQTQKAEGGTPEAYRLPLDIAFDPHHLPLTKRRLEFAANATPPYARAGPREDAKGLFPGSAALGVAKPKHAQGFDVMTAQ